MTEARITTQIIKALKKRGGWWVKIHGSAFQSAGIPDIIGCYRGILVALEVKTPDTAKNVSERQRHVMSRIRQAGGVPRVVTSAKAALEVIRDVDTRLDKYEGWSS